MIPTASSLYLRAPVGVPYNYGGQTYYTGGSYSAVAPQNYYARSPSPYQVPNPLRLPGVSAIGSQSPISHGAPTQPLTSNSAVMNDDTPVTTRRFNAYKENRDTSQLNASAASLRAPQANASSVNSGALPNDFGQMLKQAVADAVRAERGQSSPLSFTAGPIELKQLEEVLIKERDERKSLKSQLKQEKKHTESLNDKLRASEKARSDMEVEVKRLDRENANRVREIEILQNELSDMRNERILAEQLDEEHSAKMKVYTQDLMATSTKYQQDIQNLISRNEKLTKEAELLKAKAAELDRQATHAEQVKDALNRKLLGKENEIAALQSQLEKVSREKKQPTETPWNNGKANSQNNTLFLENRIRELEAEVESQKRTIQENEYKILNSSSNDAFGILRSSNALTPARRVSLLTSRKEEGSQLEAAPTLDWLEPLKIADHVLANMS